MAEPVSASPGGSHEQLHAELEMLALLAERLGVSLKPQRLAHPEGPVVDVDGVSEDLSVLVECWAHQGPAKGAQRVKPLVDAAKLSWIAAGLPTEPTLMFCASDPLAIKHLQGKSWMGHAIAGLGVSLEIVELSAETAATIREAQKRQYR